MNDRFKILTNDNKNFQVTASYLLDFAQRAEKLFLESDDALRQKLLEYLLSNLELKDKKLSYVLNETFKTIVETKKKALSGSNSIIWCTIVDALQTAAIGATNDYKLKHLAEVFNLSSNLISQDS